MNKNILYSESKWIEVSGKGGTFKDAIENAFKEMRKSLSVHFDEPIVSMRTEDVVLMDSSKEERNEAFLFFFMKRKKKTWHIRVNINITIDCIKFEEE